MPLAMFRGETSIEALAARLFRLSSGNSQAGRQATEALLRANPQLANLERVPPGSVIVVPDTAAAVNAGETVQPAAFTLTDSAGLLAEHVAAFVSALAAQTADAAAQANSTLKLVRDRSLATAAGKDQDLAQRLAAISDNTKTTLADLQAQQATLEQAVGQLQEDLAKFTNASLPPGPTGAETSGHGTCATAVAGADALGPRTGHSADAAPSHSHQKETSHSHQKEEVSRHAPAASRQIEALEQSRRSPADATARRAGS